MLQFSHQPPLEATRYAMRLLRTPTAGKLHLVVTSDQMLGCWTHYYSGRTNPCTGPGCEPCEHGASSRWHAYLSAYDPPTDEHLLFECTAAAAEVFAAYRAKHGTLRGCEFVAQRVQRRANARVHIICKPANLQVVNLPAEANVQAALCHLWGVPLTETDIIMGDLGTRTVDHHGAGLPDDRGNGRKPAPVSPQAKE